MLPAGTTPAPSAAAAAWLPPIGAVTGALSGAVAELVATRSHALGVATAFVMPVVLTGALHLDGFADGCDAFFANVSPARRLEILKDPRHGTFALAGSIVVSALWLAALADIAPARYPVVLATAAMAARLGAVAHMRYVKHARAENPSPAFVARPPGTILLADALALAALAAFAPPFPRDGVAPALAGFLAATLALTWARRKLDGAAVGDTYGFAIVAGETAAVCAAALMPPR